MIADSNFLLDLISKDRKRHARAVEIVRSARTAKRAIRITTSTVHELVYVLETPQDRNGFGLDREKIKEVIASVLDEKSFLLEESAVISRSAEIFVDSKLAFHDCYLLSLAEDSQEKLLSFDRELAARGLTDPLALDP